MAAVTSSQFLNIHLGWFVAGAIVVIGLVVLGWRDLWRFSISRVWAISSVCFDESIRKKVLWLTPLAMVGIVVIAQLQQALDEQDVIRQTVKICIFAAAIVMVLSSIILACTNLPKEIETRVIYTIVTKPTTRLELIVGKVLGFARVSGSVLIIMGLFTWGYLEIRQRAQLKQVNDRLQAGIVSPTEQSRLAHYSQAGLLNARITVPADDFQIYGDKPDPTTPRRIIYGNGDGDLLAGFVVDQARLFPDGPSSGIGNLGLVITVDMGWKIYGEMQDSLDPDQVKQKDMGPAQPRPPGVSVELTDAQRYTFIYARSLVGGSSTGQLIQHMREWASDPEHKPPVWSGTKVRLHAQGSKEHAYVWVPPGIVKDHMYRNGGQGDWIFFVRVSGTNSNVAYSFDEFPVHVYMPAVDEQKGTMTSLLGEELGRLKDEHGKPLPMICRGKIGIRGEEQLAGGKLDLGPDVPSVPTATVVYSFRNAPAAQLANGQIPFELANLQIQRGNEADESQEDPTTLSITVRDLHSLKETTVSAQVETRQTTFFSVPAGALSGGDFDVMIQCPNQGHTVGFFPESLQMISGREAFAFNLGKSLAILWLMSILVIAVSILCSTFLSWPVAMVLTVILLLGHWGVNQLSDVNAPGLGATIVNDFKLSDAPVAKVVSSSVDELSKGLNLFAKGLPDMAQFDAIGDIEQSAAVPTIKLSAALQIVGLFGLPAMVLAYLIFKRKEVAP